MKMSLQNIVEFQFTANPTYGIQRLRMTPKKSERQKTNKQTYLSPILLQMLLHGTLQTIHKPTTILIIDETIVEHTSTLVSEQLYKT